MEAEAEQQVESKNSLSPIAILALAVSSLCGHPVYAGDVPVSQVTEEPSFWQGVRKRIRARTFTEMMTPAIDSSKGQIPDNDGSPFAPMNAFNILWTDYEFADDLRIVYWQRVMVNIVGTSTHGPMDFTPRNPRFALRKTKFFDNKNLSTTYDLYVQPGLASEATNAGRTFEFGFRTASSYSFPGSRFSIGMITEMTGVYSKFDMPGANFYGWFMPWMSYDLNKTFSTQHYVTLNYQHMRGDHWSKFQYDYPMPYMQNGIGMSISKNVWASVFINNYITAPPTLKNTWASLWLSLEIL